MFAYEDRVEGGVKGSVLEKMKGGIGWYRIEFDVDCYKLCCVSKRKLLKRLISKSVGPKQIHVVALFHSDCK